MKFISYAQNFEDVMLWRALKHIRNGFYIDVGAYDPTEHSVTKFFYDSGWSGINIEPVASYFKKFSLERPRDITLDLLISDKEGETVFYENDTTGLSSSVEDNIKTWQNESNFKFNKVKKTTKTLNTVCAENKVGTVHFLKIDVEGLEINVLRGFSFDAIRPWIVLFEAVAPTGDHRDISSDCVSYLNFKKYHQVYFDGLNKFFVSDEHKELDVAFLTPLNIFDYSSIQLSNSHFLIGGKLKELEQISQKKEKETLFTQRKAMDEISIRLDSTKAELDSTVMILDSTRSELDSTKTELNSTKYILDTTRSQLDLRFHELSSIYASRGWKTIVFLYKISVIIIPKGSRRRKVAKYLWRYLKVPLKLFLKVARRFRKIFTTPVKVIQSSNSDDLKNLSPRARKIYIDLKAAVEARNKNK
jgi:FkbM family methyltransferase